MNSGEFSFSDEPGEFSVITIFRRADGCDICDSKIAIHWLCENDPENDIEECFACGAAEPVFSCLWGSDAGDD